VKIFAAFLFCLFGVNSFSNEIINQLKDQLKTADDSDIELRINLLNDLSWEYAYQNLDTALFFAAEAIQLAENAKSKYPNLLANSYGTLGIIFDLEGNNQKALKYYFKALEIKTSLNDSSGIANMKTNIGALFFTQSDYNKALPYFNEALEIEIALNDSVSQIGSYINIAIILKNQKQAEAAKAYLKKALALTELIHEDYYYGLIYSNLGAQYLETDELDSSLYYFNKGKEFHFASENYYNYGIALENEAKIYLKKGQLDRANKHGRDALRIATEGKYYLLLTNSYETLFEINLALGQFDSAFYYKAMFEELNDSILKKENKQIVDEIEAKYELQKKQTDILAKDIEIEAGKRQSWLYLLITIGSVITALFLIWIVILKIRSNRLLNFKNLVIEDSLKEKEVLMREIHHRVKNNIQAIKSIISIQKRSSESEETKESLTETLNRINAMALIHNKLYQQDRLDAIGSDIYLTELTKDVLKTFGLRIDDPTIKIDFCNRIFKTDELLTLGLVYNELLTNACKYGQEASGSIQLEIISIVEQGQFKLSVTNSKNSEFSVENGFGTELIQALLHKIKGKINYLSETDFTAKIEIDE
jgi:two-component sensor histidine kinase